MNTESDEVEGCIGEAAVTDDESPRRERKVVQAPGRSAGKVKQMVDRFIEDDGWGDLSDA